jgi:hypothetical protein
MSRTFSPLVDDSVVGVYDNHAAAESSVKTLADAGFDLHKLSIIGKGYRTEEHALGFYTTGDRIKAWGSAGGFWGAIWGLLAGPAVFFIPSVGLIAVAGPLGIALIAALESAVVVGGVSALGAALVGLGMSKERAIKYESDIKADRFVVLVHGTAAELASARAILASSQEGVTA